MMIRAGRHLRQVRDSQHLTFGAQLLHQAPDGFGHGPADPGIDLVEHQRARGRITAPQCAGGDRDRQRNSRQLTARGHLAQGARCAAGMTCHQELGRLHPEGLR